MPSAKELIGSKLFNMTRNLDHDLVSSKFRFSDPKTVIETLLRRKGPTHNISLEMSTDNVKSYIDYILTTKYRLDIRFQKNVVQEQDIVYNSIVSYLDSTTTYDTFSVKDSIADNIEKVKLTHSQIGVWTYNLDAYDFYDIRLIVNTGLSSDPILSFFVNIKD